MTDKSPSAIRYTKIARESPPHRLLSTSKMSSTGRARCRGGEAGEQALQRPGRRRATGPQSRPSTAPARGHSPDRRVGVLGSARPGAGQRRGCPSAGRNRVAGGSGGRGSRAADYHELNERQRRVGFCHLVLNLVATVIFTASYVGVAVARQGARCSVYSACSSSAPGVRSAATSPTPRAPAFSLAAPARGDGRPMNRCFRPADRVRRARHRSP